MRWTLYLATAAVLALGMTHPGAADEPKVDPKAKQFKVQGKFSEILPTIRPRHRRASRPDYTLEGRKSSYHSGSVGIHANAIVGGASRLHARLFLFGSDNPSRAPAATISC